MLRVHKTIRSTGIAGPGQRFCLWVQGCRRRCEGCSSVATWDTSAGTPVSPDDIISDVLSTKGIEGVTFLGGEPFEQAEALHAIGKALRKEGLSVVTFTGCTVEELLSSNDDAVRGLLAVTDLLIDGAFEIEKRSTDRPWVGSSNQRYIFLTERYSQEHIANVGNRFEVRISKDGKALVAGMGDLGRMREYIV